MNYWIFPGITNFNKFEYDELVVSKRFDSLKELEKTLLESSYTEYIINICQKIFEVKDIKSIKRSRELTEARFASWYLMKKILLMTYMKIGRVYRKDHSTIIHGVKEHDNLYEYTIEYRTRFNDARNLLINKMKRDDEAKERISNKQ